MKTRVQLFAAFLFSTLFQALAATNEPVTLFMPDGQMSSHLLRVYVTADIQHSDKPEITLVPGKYLKPGWTQKPIAPREIARFQHWTEIENGIGLGRTGTLLLFDIRESSFSFAPFTRVTPILKWAEPRQTVIRNQPIYIGNMIGAAIIAFVSVGILTMVIWSWASRMEGDADTARFGWKRLLLNPQNHLSLSKTQAAFWTFLVAWMVLCIGLTRLEVPVIPESLVALMGLSLATRAAIYVTEQEDPSKMPTPPPPGNKPTLPDLIRSSSDTGNPVAITKAQMLLWTCVAGALFVMKSLLNGELWDVPWQLVTLMGISQASYVIPPALQHTKK